MVEAARPRRASRGGDFGCVGRAGWPTALGDAHGFVLVGEEEIQVREYGADAAVPGARGIVVGVEGGGETGFPGEAEQFGRAGLKGGEQIVAGDVQVAGGADVIEVHISEGEGAADAGIADHGVVFGEGHGDADAGGAGGIDDEAGDIHAGGHQRAAEEGAEFVVPHLAYEADGCAQARGVAGENAGGAAEGEAHAFRLAELAVGRELGEAGEDEIHVEVADDCDIHRLRLFRASP